MVLTPANTPAPALTRGIELLRRLERDGAQTLERLVRDTGWPKSSVARLLLSLEAEGLLWRDPAGKRYHARFRLAPIAEDETGLLLAWRTAADRLSRQAGQTVELYRFHDGRLVMIDRLEPEDALVTARARIGFERWFDEVDALTLVSLAFGLPPRDWPKGRLWAWRGGKRTRLARMRRDSLTAAARSQGIATDLGVNVHGVFRYAAPILSTERLIAVIAIAQVSLPGAATPDHALTAQLRETAAALTPAVSLRQT